MNNIKWPDGYNNLISEVPPPNIAGIKIDNSLAAHYGWPDQTFLSKWILATGSRYTSEHSNYGA